MTMPFLLFKVKAKEYVNHMKDLLEVLRSKIKSAQTKYEDDRNRNCLSAITMKTDDEVWLDAKNI